MKNALLAEDPSFYEADKSFEDLLRHSLELERPRLIRNLKRNHPEVTLEQHAKLYDVARIAGATFDWEAYAVIRLLRFGDDASFCLARTMHARQKALDDPGHEDRFTDTWGLLASSAVGDQASLLKILDRIPDSVCRGHRATVLLCNELSLLLRGKTRGDTHRNDAAKGQPQDWIASLTGFIRSPSLLQDEQCVTRYLKLFRSRSDYSELNSIVPVELIGLAHTLGEAVHRLAYKHDDALRIAYDALSNFSVEIFNRHIVSLKRDHLTRRFVELQATLPSES